MAKEVIIQHTTIRSIEQYTSHLERRSSKDHVLIFGSKITQKNIQRKTYNRTPRKTANGFEEESDSAIEGMKNSAVAAVRAIVVSKLGTLKTHLCYRICKVTSSYIL